MSHTIESFAEVPAADCYVVAHDTFMSRWGQAEGMENWILLPCSSRDEAMAVMANAKARGDQKRVRCVLRDSVRKAFARQAGRVVWSLLTRDTAGRWYQSGAFGTFGNSLARSIDSGATHG